MKSRNPVPFFFSLILHAAFFAAFTFFTVQRPVQPVEQYTEIGFGGEGFGAGGTGIDLQEPGGNPPASEEAVTEKPKEETVPVKSESNDESAALKTRKSTNPKTQDGNGSGSGPGVGSGTGLGFGYDIDWGGGGRRRIYSFIVPEYPAGVNKELDIRIRFTIFPDGSVGKTFLLTKGDTRLEAAALNSLRQWRFEPLKAQQQQTEQTAVIVFPFRLQ